MPDPEEGETEKDYLKRCISELKEEGYTDNKQRVAVCFAKYRKSGTESKSPEPEKNFYSKDNNKNRVTGNNKNSQYGKMDNTSSPLSKENKIKVLIYIFQN